MARRPDRVAVRPWLVGDNFPTARTIISALPDLPPVLNYLDEYDDTIREIPNPAESNVWMALADTRKFRMSFDGIEDDGENKILRHFLVWFTSQSGIQEVFSTGRAIIDFSQNHGGQVLLEAMERPVPDWPLYWETEIRHSVSQRLALATKYFLYFLCDCSLAGWSVVFEPIIRRLPFERQENYAGVRSRDVFLTVDEESKIISWLDEQADRVSHGEHLTDSELLDFCLVCICHEHALRPVQIARINLSDLRQYTGVSDEPVVHFTAFRVKKRNGRHKTPFIRKVLRRWAPPFSVWLQRRHATLEAEGHPLINSVKAFNLPLNDIIVRIGNATEAVTGVRRTANHLRHSAAQRLADAGATVEEVAEFLGHSHLDTSLIYFEASEAQSALINKALAISPVYSRIVEVARTGFIDRKLLEATPADQQIGAVPHGIPITGIGACRTGQSLCTLDPALSCYTCRKFIPINETEVHREVLGDLRGVVKLFYGEARGDSRSPAYVQLRRTLEAIQAVIIELDGPPTTAES